MIKVLKVIAIILVSILILGILTFFGAYYYYGGRFEADEEKYPQAVGYIDTSKALRNTTYELCNADALYSLHSPRHVASYEGSKKRFRENVLKQYDSTAYKDSGYVNFRFLINCKGQPGWFEIRETDLNYEKSSFDQNLVTSLLDITGSPEHWAIRNIGPDPIDYYMYVTYRLEDGKITEILP